MRLVSGAHPLSFVWSYSLNTVNITPSPDGRLSTADASRYLSFAPRTLSNWRLRGVGPRSVKIAGRVFYYLSDLDAFIASGQPRGGLHD